MRAAGPDSETDTLALPAEAPAIASIHPTLSPEAMVRFGAENVRRSPEESEESLEEVAPASVASEVVDSPSSSTLRSTYWSTGTLLPRLTQSFAAWLVQGDIGVRVVTAWERGLTTTTWSAGTAYTSSREPDRLNERVSVPKTCPVLTENEAHDMVLENASGTGSQGNSADPVAPPDDATLKVSVSPLSRGVPRVTLTMSTLSKYICELAL
mmetsp:Transcript_31241/g.73302  ORF Transcript_31241/g.73302 Transcript_31241/m.73302 type:complete len:211 (-) Transcript_31241:813-1445(-)